MHYVPVLMAGAIVVILVVVVVLAVGRGGEMAHFPNDYAPPRFGALAATDVALLRPPTALCGYHMQATDEVFSNIALALSERDVRIASLERQLGDLRAGRPAAGFGSELPAPDGPPAKAEARSRPGGQQQRRIPPAHRADQGGLRRPAAGGAGTPAAAPGFSGVMRDRTADGGGVAADAVGSVPAAAAEPGPASRGERGPAGGGDREPGGAAAGPGGAWLVPASSGEPERWGTARVRQPEELEPMAATESADDARLASEAADPAAEPSGGSRSRSETGADRGAGRPGAPPDSGTGWPEEADRLVVHRGEGHDASHSPEGWSAAGPDYWPDGGDAAIIRQDPLGQVARSARDACEQPGLPQKFPAEGQARQADGEAPR